MSCVALQERDPKSARTHAWHMVALFVCEAAQQQVGCLDFDRGQHEWSNVTAGGIPVAVHYHQPKSCCRTKTIVTEAVAVHGNSLLPIQILVERGCAAQAGAIAGVPWLLYWYCGVHLAANGPQAAANTLEGQTLVLPVSYVMVPGRVVLQARAI